MTTEITIGGNTFTVESRLDNYNHLLNEDGDTVLIIPADIPMSQYDWLYWQIEHAKNAAENRGYHRGKRYVEDQIRYVSDLVFNRRDPE